MVGGTLIPGGWEGRGLELHPTVQFQWSGTLKPGITGHPTSVIYLSIHPQSHPTPATGIDITHTWPLLLAIVVGPKAGHMTQAGPIRVLPWDLYVLRQKERQSLSSWESLNLSKATEVSLKVPVVCLSPVEEACLPCL